MVAEESLQRIHIALLRPEYARLVLSGKKTVESRLAKTRRAPFGSISAGDRIYFKQTSGGFVATALVERVESFFDLEPAGVDALKERFNARVLGTDEYWKVKSDSRYATMIHLADVEPISSGPDTAGIVPPGSQAGWHVLPIERDVYPGCIDAGLSMSGE